MVQKERQRTINTNISDGNTRGVSGVLAGVTLKEGVLIPKRVTMQLAAVVLSMTAAQDFGSLKLCDLPTTNLRFKGAFVDLSITVAGLTTNTAVSVDVALGTVATASAAFSNAGEQNLIQKIDGVGGTATGTVKGASATEGTPVTQVELAAGAKAVYLNASSPVTSGTGTVTITGTVEFVYEDLGDHA